MESGRITYFLIIMKRSFVILTFLLLTAAATAQEKGYTLGVAAEAGPAFGGKETFYAQRFTLSPGYSFDGKWYAALPLSYACELSKAGNVKSYEAFCQVGAEGGYNLYRGGNVVTFSAAVGGTVYGEASKSLYYDIRARWGTAARFKPLVGLGMRYCQGIGNYGKDCFCIYASIGFRFN